MIEITRTLPQIIGRVRLFRACFEILTAETYGIIISSHTSWVAGPDRGPRSRVTTACTGSGLLSKTSNNCLCTWAISLPSPHPFLPFALVIWLGFHWPDAVG